MRRGLMHWDARELPLELFETRIVRLRKELALAGLNGLIIYTNNVRPSAVHYLTGFTPYWSEGLLLLPIRDRPVFATALSNRVADWIRSNDPVSEVISTPRPGTLLGERLAGDVSANQIGILEIDAMPCELFDDLSAAAPDILWVDASTQFATARSGIDTAEQRMLARADALAVAAFDQVDIEQSIDAGALAALIEKHVRLAGAEEIYLAVAPDLTADHRLNRVSKPAKLTERFAMRASIAYKGSWIRRTRTFAKDSSVARANAWFEGLVQAIKPNKPFAEQIATQLTMLPGARINSWAVEACTGSYPLSVVASSSASRGFEPLAVGGGVITIILLLNEGPWIGSAPFIVDGHSFTTGRM